MRPDLSIQDLRLALASYQGLVARIHGVLHLGLADPKDTNLEPQRFAALEAWCTEQNQINQAFGE